MMLKILSNGMFGSNSYIIGDSGEAAVIDAGVDCKDILKAAGEAGLEIKYIILTHGHIDHICSIDDLRISTGAQVLMNDGDAGMLTDPLLNGSAVFGYARTFKPADRYVSHGEIIEVGKIKLEIIHTPGHSPGCICIKTGNTVFTGDTLFYMSIGRTDLWKGNYPEIIRSIKERLMVLDENVTAYPGHGGSTTIGFEKKHNLFLGDTSL